MLAGIEIAGRCVRGVLYRRFGPGRPPDQTAEISFDPPSDSDLPPVSALMELMQRLGAHRPIVAVAVPTAWCHHRAVFLPYRSASRVAGTVPYALEGRIPGPIDSFVVEPVSDLMPAGSGGARLTAASISHPRLAALLDLLKQAGAEPCVIQPAVIASCHASGVKDGLFLRLDGAAEIAILSGGAPVFAAPLASVCPENVLAVAERVRLLVRAYQATDGSAEFSGICLASSAAMYEPLAAALRNALDCPVERVGGDNAAWLAARGVAAQIARAAHLAHNLRRGPFAWRPFSIRIERRVAVALTLAAAIVAVLAISSARQLVAARDQTALSVQRETEVYRRVIAGSGTVSLDAMKAELAQANKSSASADSGRSVSCLTRWADITQLLPSDLTMHTMDITTKRVRLAGRARSEAQAQELPRRLEASGKFVAGRKKVQAEPGGTALFDLEVTYK